METETGFIEKAGTGIRRMREDAKKNGCPEPKFTANGFFTATFRPSTGQVPDKYRTSTVQVTEQAGTKLAPSQRQVQAHDEAHEPLTKVEREILAACAGEVNWIIETKGREWEDTLAKDAAISDWCKKVSAQTGIP